MDSGCAQSRATLRNFWPDSKYLYIPAGIARMRVEYGHDDYSHGVWGIHVAVTLLLKRIDVH